MNLSQKTENKKSTRDTVCKTPQHKKLFFSYGHDSNSELIDMFKKDLEKRGHEVWIDYKEIGTWTDWREKITEGITQSVLAIVYLSKHSTRDPGVCLNEIAMILDKPMEIKPILVEPETEATPPITISHIQFLDLSQWREIKEGKIREKDFKSWYKEKLNDIIDGIENNDTVFEGDVDILRSLLKPLLFSSDISRHIEGFIGREWVFEEYYKWLKKASRLLWITGKPGFGKTAISSNLVHKHPSNIIGTWFCNHNSVDQSDPVEMLMTISYQIAYRLPDYRIKLISELGIRDIDKNGIENKRKELIRLGQKSISDLFRKLFKEPLYGLIEREHKYVIVIDALDESTDNKGDNPIAEMIVSEFINLPDSPLNFLVTSRPDASVINRLQGFKPYNINDECYKESNLQDIEKYLMTAFEFGKLKDLSTEKQKNIHNILIEKSEGLMLYIKESLKAINEGTIDLDKLDETPKGLYALYSSQFKIRFGKKFKKLKRLFRLIIASPGQIPEELACLILKIDKEKLNENLRLAGSYIIRTPDGLKVFHKTLEDWLTTDVNSDYFIDPEIEKKCIAEYLLEDFKGISGYNIYKVIVWQKQVKNWLPQLIRYSSAWDDYITLNKFGLFLIKYLDINNAVKMLDRVEEILKVLHGKSGKQLTPDIANSLARTYNDKGVALRTKGDNDGAIEEYAKAIKILEDLRNTSGKKFTPDMANSLAKAYTDKGVALRTKGDNYGAIEEYNEAIIIRKGLENTLGDEFAPFMTDNLAWTYINKGVALKAKGDNDGAIKEYNEAIKILENLRNTTGDQFTPYMSDNLAWAYINKGIVLTSFSDDKGALEENNKALEILEGLYKKSGINFQSQAEKLLKLLNLMPKDLYKRI